MFVGPGAAGVACVLAIGNKIKKGKLEKNYNRYKRQNEIGQRSINSFNKIVENAQKIF